MAADQKCNIHFVGWRVGVESNTPNTRTARMAGSQGVMIANHPLYLSQAGTLKKADTCDGTGDVFHALLRKRIATELAANTLVTIEDIHPNALYAVITEDNDANTTAPTTLIGDQYGLRVATGSGKEGFVTMDINNANAAVQVHSVWSDWCPNDKVITASTSPGTAIVFFLSANVQASKA